MENNNWRKIIKRFTNTRKIVMIILIVILIVFSGCTEKTPVNSSDKPQLKNMTERQKSKEDVKEAVIKNNYQEVDLLINASGYYPNVVIAKKGILLKINVHSDKDAGCAADIVFPDFNIKKTIPAGSSDHIEISPSQEGTFDFRCSMDMFRGKLIIK